MVIAPEQIGLVIVEGRFPIRYQDRRKSYLCRVTFDLTRKHQFLIDCLESVHELRMGPVPHNPVFLEIPGAEPVECCATVRMQIIGEKEDVRVRLFPLVSGRLVDRGLPIFRVNAGIINLHHYWFGSPKELGFRLEDESWVLDFTPVDESTFLYPNHIQNDAYSFSHHLVLRKRTGEVFTGRQANEVLSTLSTFLSFCAEHWVSPALVVGLDQTGEVAMEEWGTRMLDPRHDPGNWLDAHHGGAMAEVYPGFSHLMEDPTWEKAIRTAVYWYVRADTSHAGSDGAIVLIQAALERLAWHVLVQQRRAISEDGFSSKLRTPDRLRLLLDTNSIPLTFPTELKELGSCAPPQGWPDGPEAFVSVRNQIVHPRKRLKPMGARAYYEALQLGKWYLELVVLRACGFNGSYSNRLKIPRWRGAVERVPRASDTSG